MFLEQNTTFITTVESIKITVEQYVTVQSHFCSCIITKLAAWLCFCVTVPTGIYVCCLTHREQVHGGPTNHSQWILPVGGRLSFFYSLYFGIATCFTMSMHCFCNEKTTGKKKKNHKQEKNNSCHLQNIQSTSQALCWPPDRCHLILCSPWLQVWNSDILYSR